MTMPVMRRRASAVRLILFAGLLALFPALTHGGTPTPDSGKFVLRIRGTEFGSDTFRSDTTGGSVGDASVTAGGKQIHLHIATRYAGGRLAEVTTDGGALGKMRLTANGDRSQVKLDAGRVSKNIPQKLPARVFAFGNYSPHLVAPIVAAYDARKGGSQSFDLVHVDGVGPAGLAVLKGTLVSRGTKTARLGGRNVIVLRFLFTAGNIPIEVSADPTGRILMWNVLAQGYVAVRAGFEGLAQ